MTGIPNRGTVQDEKPHRACESDDEKAVRQFDERTHTDEYNEPLRQQNRYDPGRRRA